MNAWSSEAAGGKVVDFEFKLHVHDMFSFVLVVLEVVEVDTLVLVGRFSSRAMASSGGPLEDKVIVDWRFIGFVVACYVRFI